MCELCLEHDERVSRLHAELENVGDVWTLADHGLSRNGTFVNEERVSGQRVLHDGDVVRMGSTQVKAHLGTLFELLGVDEERQTHKRARLAETALRTGLVTRRELEAQ